MPRLIKSPFCPHCKAKLPVPKPAACPSCGGSINQRYLNVGCQSTTSAKLATVRAGRGEFALLIDFDAGTKASTFLDVSRRDC